MGIDPHYRQFKDKVLQMRPNVPDKSGDNQFARGYYSHVKNIDDNVGRIMDALRANDQLENTIVFSFADHGDFMGSHGKGGMSRPEEEASNIPLLIRLPRRVGAPTTLGLCGIPVPESCDGSDLSGLVCGNTDEG